MFLTRWSRRVYQQERTSKKSRKGAYRPCVESLEPRALLSLFGNSLFPADNPWNQRITNAPVATNSDTLVASIGLVNHVHADFGAALWQGSLIGIPWNVVSGTQSKVTVVIDAYASESDVQPIPIPNNAIIEGDPLPASQNTGDRHLLVYDKDNNLLYETFNTHRPSETPDGQWHADSEAVWDLKKNSFRPPTWTSADAAGLPILPGLVRADEVLDQGKITHAIRFTVPRSRNTFIYPASHQAGTNNAAYPRMGERFRLKQSFDITGYSPANQVILQALKDYGLIVADNGSSWYISGEPSTRWNDSDLHSLGQLVGSNFEAVDLTPIVTGLSQTSGSTAGGTPVTINGSNFSGDAGLMQVFFGSTSATNVNALSDTQISVIAPAHAAGTVDVIVQSPYGTSATSPADQFTYNPPNGNTPNQRFVSQAYLDLLGRPADASGLTFWARLLDQGGSRVDVVQALEASAEYRSVVVQALYSQLLHRGADVSGLQVFVGFLGSGGTLEQVQSILAGSSEYLQTRSGGTNDGFLDALYQDALHRPVDPNGRANFTQALANGATRSQVAAALFASDEYRQGLVQSLFQRFLQRPADGAGLALFTSALKLGARDQDVIALLVGSGEYLARL